MIALINRYFVPVYVSNEDYARNGSAPAEEKAERDRIYRESLKAGLSTGTVHVYIVHPDGHPIDSLHVAQAAKVSEMIAMLERVIGKLQLSPGTTLAKPQQQSIAPRAEPGGLVLHLTSRTLHRDGNTWTPVKPKLGETRSAGWGAYAAEDWIVLTPAEVAKLLPPEPVHVGIAWELNRSVGAKILTHVYPSTENNDVSKNRIDEQQLKGRVISAQDGAARARIDGRLRMKHPFYHKDDDNFVDATLVGFVDFEPATGKIRNVQLATEKATYAQMQFGAVVRMIAK